MMETIVSWLTLVAGEALETIVEVFLGALQLDLAVFVEVFPFAVVSFKIFQAIGMGLVLSIALFQLTKFFAGQLAETKDTPVRILIRSVLATSLIWFGGHFISIIVDLTRTPYDIFIHNTDAVTRSFNLSSIDSSFFLAGGAAALLSPSTILLLTLVLILLIGFNLIKLMLEVCERFLLVGVLAYSAPLAYPTLASQATSAIFKKWLGMFFGQCLLMIISVWSLKLVLSGFSFETKGVSNFMRLVLTLAMCKIAQRVDTYLQQLGIGVASTGGNLLDDVLGVAMAMRGMSGGGRGRPSDSVLGAEGGGRSGVPKVGGLFGAATGAFQKGLSAYKSGEDMDSVRAAVTEGAKEGRWGPLVGGLKNLTQTRADAQARTTAENAKKAQDAFNDRSQRYNANNGTAKGYSSDIQKKAAAMRKTAQQYAHAQFTSDGAGGITQGPNGNAVLDETAKNAGLIWKGGSTPTGQPEQIKGTSDAVGQHMAQNYEAAASNPEYQRAMNETAANGSSLAAQEALMTPNHDLSGNDQVGASLIGNAFGEGLNQVYGDDKDAHGKYTDMTEFTSALQMTSEGTVGYNGEGVRNITATAGPNGEGGRTVSCDYHSADGNDYKVEIKDTNAYHKLSPSEQKQMRPMSTLDGTTYYTRFNEVTISHGNTPSAPSSPSSSGSSSSPITSAPKGKSGGLFGGGRSSRKKK